MQAEGGSTSEIPCNDSKKRSAPKTAFNEKGSQEPDKEQVLCTVEKGKAKKGGAICPSGREVVEGSPPC